MKGAEHPVLAPWHSSRLCDRLSGCAYVHPIRITVSSLLTDQPGIQDLALAARKLILEEAPEAREFVYQVYTIANHFTFTERPGDAFVFTTTHANWVNLGFHFGSLLPDPESLLRGEGKWVRHVRIAQAADLQRPAVRQLVRAAIAQAERPEGRIAKPRTTVKRAQSVRRRATLERRRK